MRLENHMGFISELRKRAKQHPARIVLPEGEDERVIMAASVAQSEGLAQLVLLGRKDEILKKAGQLGVTINGVDVLDHKSSSQFKRYAEIFYELRKHKGLKLSDAERVIYESPVFYSAIMVKEGYADSFIAGAITTSSDVARAGIYCIGVDKTVGLLSSSFIIQVENSPYGKNGILLFADCAIVPEPTPEQLSAIAYSSAMMFEDLFEKKARVALLSFSTKGSADGPMVRKVREALDIAHRRYPQLIIDGELQVDSALDPEVAKRKCAGSPVAGCANVLIFPDLNSANIGYKLVHRLAGAKAIGPLMQGLCKPCSDLSRGCSWQDIVDVIAVTSIRCKGLARCETQG